MTAVLGAAPSGDLRDRILAVATRLFAEQGFAATAVRQLVEACSCTKPALYYYFDSKESLFRSVVELHLSHVEQVIRDWLDSDGSIRERTHRSVASFIDHAEAHPDAMRLLQRIELQPEAQVPGVNAIATRELHLSLIGSLFEQAIGAGEIRAGIAPRECALVLAGTMSFQFELALATGVWERERIHRTIDLIFDGIAV